MAAAGYHSSAHESATAGGLNCPPTEVVVRDGAGPGSGNWSGWLCDPVTVLVKWCSRPRSRFHRGNRRIASMTCYACAWATVTPHSRFQLSVAALHASEGALRPVRLRVYAAGDGRPTLRALSRRRAGRPGCGVGWSDPPGIMASLRRSTAMALPSRCQAGCYAGALGTSCWQGKAARWNRRSFACCIPTGTLAGGSLISS